MTLELCPHSYWYDYKCHFLYSNPVYFSTGLYIAQNISAEMEEISRWNGSVVETANMTSLFPKRVNVMCDPASTLPISVSSAADTGSGHSNSDGATDTIGDTTEREVGIFLEIQTCWVLVSDQQQNQLVQLEEEEEEEEAGDMEREGASSVMTTRSDDRAKNTELEMRDCPVASATAFTAPCPSLVFITNFQ